MVVWARGQEERDAVAHAPREGRGMGHRRWRHRQTMLHPPRRRGRPEVTRDWPAKASHIKAWGIASIARTPKHPYVGTGRRLQIGRDQAFPRPGRRQRWGHPRGRLEVRLDGGLQGRPLSVLAWEVRVSSRVLPSW